MQNEQSDDPYKMLQIGVEASQEEVEAAYQLLAAQYDPARLTELASDLRQLAERRQRQIETAYQLLRDPALRAFYDAGRRRTLAAQSQDLAAPGTDDLDLDDYRPLGSRASSASGVRPIAGASKERRDRPTPGVAALIVAGLAALVLALSLLLTGKERGYEDLTAAEMLATATAAASAPLPTLEPALTAAVTDTALLEFLGQQQQRIDTLAATARQQGRAEDWVAYGNAVFDYLETLREQTGGGAAYQDQAARRWGEALEAYAQALALEPTNGPVRSDYALGLLRLGQASDDDATLEEAQRQASQALQDDAQGLRTMLNAAIVFMEADPTRAEEARALLQLIVERAPESREAALAGQLLQGGTR